jgi:hypothetical protein
MATSQNGFRVLQSGSPALRKFEVPGCNRHLNLVDGSRGFLLIHYATYWDRFVERLDRTGSVWDEWGHAVRPVRGQTSGYSNHASGTAEDLNSTLHPRGVSIHKTFTDAQIKRLRRRLLMYDGCLRWGGDYQNVPDGMHVEINKGLPMCEKTAKRLMRTKIGKEVLTANPGLKKVILS